MFEETAYLKRKLQQKNPRVFVEIVFFNSSCFLYVRDWFT